MSWRCKIRLVFLLQVGTTLWQNLLVHESPRNLLTDSFKIISYNFRNFTRSHHFQTITAIYLKLHQLLFVYIPLHLYKFIYYSISTVVHVGIHFDLLHLLQHTSISIDYVVDLHTLVINIINVYVSYIPSRFDINVSVKCST